MTPPTWYFSTSSAAVRTPISLRFRSMSAWSGAVAEWPYTRMTKSWPTFSSSDMREMSSSSVRSLVASLAWAG